MAKLCTFWSVKYTPLVEKHSKFNRMFIPWRYLTKNVISKQNPGKPICRNSNANSEPLNWANMPSYSGLENTPYKVPDFKIYRHVVPYKFPVSVSDFNFFWPRFGFSPGPEKAISGFKTCPAVGCRLIVKNIFRKKSRDRHFEIIYQGSHKQNLRLKIKK